MSSQSCAREASLVMASRVAKELGFEAAEETALEALADVVRYHINCLARRAAANARHSRRSDLALNDVLAALRQSPSAPQAWPELRFWRRPSLLPRRAPGMSPSARVEVQWRDVCLLEASNRLAAGEFAARWRLPATTHKATLPAPAPRRPAHYGGLGAADAPAPPRSAHIPAFLPPFPPAVARRKRPAAAEAPRDDVRDVEALQLALNRIDKAKKKARPGGEFAPIEVDG